ncbi:carbohydrate-binding protein [Coraliomargarita algicola]|uniref:Carbohydrate-binding protein n=1 Tax=Coraliomargarita algicola TaxID=3092156 RepID=A0ABZ0RL73_9BACT|nr:carbohydrate-binding protein [Coraliomargarita sp. J2-16]WPJ95833.1 carbohydrate-binding protein [Coraliomargarita sp. J2-16]
MPNTTTNRLATQADADYWPNVNVDDYIYFSPDDNHGGLYDSPPVGLGKKVHIYAGDYTRISLKGDYAVNSQTQPTIITNLGGQVRMVGTTDWLRSLSISGFMNVHVTGKYDPVAQTGDPNYLGHNGGANMGDGEYYRNYGIWVDNLWAAHRASADPLNTTGVGNLVRIQNFDYCKIDYVAAFGGGFAAFNLKNDQPYAPDGVCEVDAQDCFAAFTTSESFYIGKFTANYDRTKLTLRNNIMFFSGTEAMQTDGLVEGSRIENNIIYGSASNFRTPFQSSYQEGLQQLSYSEGDIEVRNNIMVGGMGMMQTIRKSDNASEGSPSASKKFIYDNNYLGMGRAHASYIWNGDDITPYEFTNNIWGPLDVPNSNDAYTNEVDATAFQEIGVTGNPTLISGNLYDPLLQQWAYTYNGGTCVTEVNNEWRNIPQIKFMNTGFADDFDMRRVTIWAPIFETDGYAGRDGEYITYQTGDVVIHYEMTGSEAGMTKLYQCISTHTADATNYYYPDQSPTKWQQLTWNGNNMPPVDVRIQPDTFYNYRGLGLTYNPANLNADDLEAPEITLLGGNKISFEVGSSYFDPGYIAVDNVDGNLSESVVTTWITDPIDMNQTGEYAMTYDVMDAAGNKAYTAFRTIYVSDTNITYGTVSKVNMHKNSGVNSLYPDWTDLGNGGTGLEYNGLPTNTDLYDVNGVATGWHMLIENIYQGYSQHSKIYTNSAGLTIGDFPTAITRQGIKITAPYNDPCVFRMTGMDPNKYYEVSYTGYIENYIGYNIDATLLDAITGEGDTIIVEENVDQVGLVANAKPDSTGLMDLIFTTEHPIGTPNISGLIITEKSGYGIAPSGITRAPYGGAVHSIPGRTEAEDYDIGGEGDAYHDTTTGNTPNKYRSDDVDVGISNGEYMIGWIANGEWLEYTVNVATTGNYDLSLRLAQNSHTDKSISMSVDGGTPVSVTTTYTGGWNSFSTFNSNGIYLTEGQHVLRFELNSGYNFDWFELSSN